MSFVKEETPTNTPTDLISRRDAIEAVATVTMSIHLSNVLCDKLLALPSAEPPYQYSEAYVNQLRGERDFLQDMVDTMAERLAEPKTKCIAQIRIDRDDIEDMVNEKVNEMEVNMAEPKTGRDCTDFIRWLMDEVMDEENWHLNAVANGEVICRKLKKLGLLDVVDGYYVETQKTGKWVRVIDEETPNVTKWHYECDQCGAGRFENGQQHCSRCGARMLGEDGEA